ncbi:FAD-dependent oxidoreductase [Adlercreutzia sp. R25]|uniref:FAD-dependent oxidoreductase n=1 Tax=Adlercreutzia shanghongiae TaxID=3111773 RepID=UPI002DB8EB4A|nr:FAD-dependent oxidoreductase [Adlercreutzia sp. R25]MEC4273083.1 FAD-dependent oxidoreductase [Adlercreutzia sp. R25]
MAASINTVEANGAVSRRGFMRLMATAGLATGVAGLTGCAPQATADKKTDANDLAETGSSWRDVPAPIDESLITDTQEADVIVVGGGLAGVSTAASAVENGLTVIVLEKNETPRMTGLDFGCVNSTLAKEAGLELSDEDIYKMTREWIHMSGNRARADIILKFIRESGAAVDWIVEKAEAWGCRPVLAAMRSNSDMYFNYIHPVEFPDGPLYDLETASFGANDIITMLQKQVTDGGSQYLVQVAAEQLEKEGERVAAVIAKNADGDYVRFKGKKGVVLCTGDFGGDEAMMNELTAYDFESFDPEGYFNASMSTGDGHKMGLWAGGAFQMGPQPLMMLPQTYPYFYLHVNDRGERFCNEDCDSVNMCINQLQQHEAKAWSIWDNKWREEIPASLEVSGGMSWDQDFREMGTPWSAEVEEVGTHSWEADAGLLVTADTLDELASAVGIPADALKATVDRYNELVEGGVDLDFGKRQELMTSISEPPFYALRMQTGMCVSVGGLNVDTNSQILDEAGAPIEGLYAVGNTAAGLFGVDYNEAPVPGVSLGRCVTFGKLLGEHLASI